MKKKKDNTNYWLCIIGSASEKYLKKYNGADSVLRFPVKEAYHRLTEGKGDFDYCASGWGMSKKKAQMILDCWNMDENELADMLELHKIRKIME